MGKQTKSNSKSNEDDEPIIPMKYQRKPEESMFAFKNLYCEYARFHMEPTNQIIHMIFIPLLIFSINGLFQTLKWSIILDMSKSFDIQFIQGDYSQAMDGPNRFYVDPMVWLWYSMCVVYIYAEPVVGFGTFIWGNVVYYVGN